MIVSVQGYSSLAVALVLPDSACLVACERDAKSLEIAKKYYELAGVSHKVGIIFDAIISLLQSCKIIWIIWFSEACCDIVEMSFENSKDCFSFWWVQFAVFVELDHLVRSFCY